MIFRHREFCSLYLEKIFSPSWQRRGKFINWNFLFRIRILRKFSLTVDELAKNLTTLILRNIFSSRVSNLNLKFLRRCVSWSHANLKTTSKLFHDFSRISTNFHEFRFPLNWNKSSRKIIKLFDVTSKVDAFYLVRNQICFSRLKWWKGSRVFFDICKWFLKSRKISVYASRFVATTLSPAVCFERSGRMNLYKNIRFEVLLTQALNQNEFTQARVSL